MWACSATIQTTFEPVGQLQASLTEVRDNQDQTGFVEDGEKGDILNSSPCEDKGAKSP